MARHTLMSAAVLLTALVMVGCSGDRSNSPITTSPSQEQFALADIAGAQKSQTLLWGYYDFHFDPENGKIEPVLNRSVMYAINVVKFLNNDPAGIAVKFNGSTPGMGYIDIDMDITIKHPMDNEKFDGYDVRGVFMGRGSGTLEYSGDLKYPASGIDQQLLNADGYTRWYNAVEFGSPTIFGYVKGNLAPKNYSPTATLNPYKYFGEGLGPTDPVFDYLVSGEPNAGYFLHGTSNTRNYLVHFPIPVPGIKYGYAVVASWAGGAPEYHPAHAKEAVAVSVADDSTLYFVDETNKGGKLKLDISVFDWASEPTGGVMEDYAMIIESTVLSTPYTLNSSEMTPQSSGDHWYTYHVSVPGDSIQGTQGNEMWLIVQYPDIDYSNPFGIPNDAQGDPLAALFRSDVTVASEPPLFPAIQVSCPNGDEVWGAGYDHEIAWTSENLTGTVFLQYSKDYFVSDIHTIATDEPDDGSFIWSPVPDDFATTVRVKVSSTEDPEVFDTSDADFSIVMPWIQLTFPNGGEVWDVGSDQEITWASEGIDGNIRIDYSVNNFLTTSLVAADTENDGNHLWEDIPCMDSDTVRMRVTSILNTAVFDLTDDYLSILVPEGGWARKSGMPDADRGIDLVTDSDGNIYVTGNRVNQYNPYTDTFVSKQGICGESGNVSWGAAAIEDATNSTGIAIDTANDIYVCGYFQGTVDFDPSVGGSDLHTASGDNNSFLSKFNSMLEHQWTVTWGGNLICAATDVSYDSTNGDIYVSGSWSGTDVDFDPSEIGQDLHTSAGAESEDAYLSKFGPDGSFKWAQTWGGSDMEETSGVTGNKGDVYVCGKFRSTDADFDPGPGTDIHSASALDVCVSKLDSSGSFQWARTWGGPENDSSCEVPLDSLGNVYISGRFMGTDVDFDPSGGTDLHSSAGGTDAFLSSFTSAGDFRWAATWGGSGSDFCNGLICGGDQIFAVGGFTGTVDFDPGPGDDSRGTSGAFLSEFDDQGVYQWGRDWGESTSTWAYSVNMVGDGNVGVTGVFVGTADFAPTGDPCYEDPFELTSEGETEMFLLKYLSDGCW